tara:strand:+ start:8444 stop:9184 length:741 start_codon:yes stop_codon:yes gene_type:complete
MIKVVINGAKGKMGESAILAVTNDESLSLVGQLDKHDSLADFLNKQAVDIVVDLTHPSCVYENVKTILNANCHAIVGTTGLSDEQLSLCNKLALQQKKALLVCPNFSIGAILMMHFSQKAAKYFNRCEIIEYHHDKKADAPSGTAIKTADLIADSSSHINHPNLDETELIKGSRGGQRHAVPIHSLRVPGVIANQDVLFGSEGQTLTISHNTISRDAFIPGILLAIKEATNYSGLVYGLENLLNLS